MYLSMSGNFRAAFLIMSANDEQSLKSHKNTYKNFKQKYLIGTFCLKIFGHDLYMWKEAMGAYQFYMDRLLTKKKPDSFDSLMKDLM